MHLSHQLSLLLHIKTQTLYHTWNKPTCNTTHLIIEFTTAGQHDLLYDIGVCGDARKMRERERERERDVKMIAYGPTRLRKIKRD